MKSKTYHLTTAIPYVNAKPHLGHILEWFQADAIARYQRLLGKEVSFTSGADENSLKNVQAADKAGLPIAEYLDEYSSIFQSAYRDYQISLTDFIRGSDRDRHWPGVQKLWQLCESAGDIYKKSYQGHYCTGCEAFYNLDDLENGRCGEHPGEELKLIEEENYFFALSKYQQQIRDLIDSNQLKIVSDRYRKEMLGFIDQGLEDFSISRSNERARGVGVPVPGDDTQKMYVWFDALTLYMTTLGFGGDDSDWQKFWPADLHVIGKGINRFHSIYWIGILLSAQIPTPKAISVHGYLTAAGQKMSKSLGNVIAPQEVVEKYGLEPVRYYLLKAVPTHSDGDFSSEGFETVYTADLANGLGNVCARVAALAAKSELVVSDERKALERVRALDTIGSKSRDEQVEFDNEYSQLLDQFKISEASEWLITKVANLDGFLSEHKPWLLSKKEQQPILEKAVEQIRQIGLHLWPIMPETSQTILSHFAGPKIDKIEPLFPRLK